MSEIVSAMPSAGVAEEERAPQEIDMGEVRLASRLLIDFALDYLEVLEDLKINVS
jgi:hypothetical protein